MTQREEKRQPRKDTRLEKYMALLALPTAAVNGPMATATRICARKYWQLSREMSTPIPRRVPSACEPTNCGDTATESGSVPGAAVPSPARGSPLGSGSSRRAGSRAACRAWRTECRRWHTGTAARRHSWRAWPGLCPAQRPNMPQSTVSVC